MRIRNNRSTATNPGLRLAPFGAGEERDVSDEIGAKLVKIAGFSLVVKTKGKKAAPKIGKKAKASTKKGKK